MGESENANDRSNSGASTVDREFVMGYEGGPRAASSVSPELPYHTSYSYGIYHFFSTGKIWYVVMRASVLP